MRYITARECTEIALGRQGENNVTTVQFDVSGWAEEYGSGTFMLLNQRSEDTVGYPVESTVENETVSWVVKSADVYYSGYGKVQLTYTVDNKIAKDVIYVTHTDKSIDGGDIPDPTPDWVAEVLHYGSEMENSQHNAEAWAIGKINGEDVPDTDERYHNNSKWYAEQAQESKMVAVQSAESAEESARQAMSFVGSPWTALTADEMTDTSRVYVYVGTEIGYINGDWYYYNGEEWTSGGVYNSIAVDVASVEDYLGALYS